MKIKKFIRNILIAFLVAIFILSMAVSTHAETNISLPKTYSENIFSYDLTGHEELFGKNENKKMFPASITKVLAAEAMLKEKNIKNFNSAATVIQKEDIEKAVQKGLYISGLTPGEKVTWNDLFHSMLYMSGAEACYALLRVTFDGNEKKAAEKMNEISEASDMKNSHFENITGAHGKNHYTTAKDFSKVLIKAWQNPYLHRLFSAESYTTADRRHIFRSPVLRYKTACGQELIGGKTGFTTPAQHTFAGFSKVKGHIIITVTGHTARGVSQPHMHDARTINNFITQNFHEVILTKSTKNTLPRAQKVLLDQSSNFKNKILVKNNVFPEISDVKRIGERNGEVMFLLGKQEKSIKTLLPEEKKKITKSSSSVVHAKEGNTQKKHQNIKTGDRTDISIYYSALTVIFICAAGMIFSIKKNIKS